MLGHLSEGNLFFRLDFVGIRCNYETRILEPERFKDVRFFVQGNLHIQCSAQENVMALSYRKQQQRRMATLYNNYASRL
jgi:hypothetical protein